MICVLDVALSPMSTRTEAGRHVRRWTGDRETRPVETVEARLASIMAPALIYTGVDDHPGPGTASGAIAAVIPRDTRVVVCSAGGFPARERPDTVNQLVLDVVRGHVPEAVA